MSMRLVVAVATTALAACSQGARPATSTTAPAPATETTAAPPITEAGTTCPSSPEFVDRGIVATLGEAEGDAAVIGAVAVIEREGCEVVELGLLTDTGAPAATIGPTSVRLSPEIGILTVRLPPEVGRTAIDDLIVERSIVERFFVVHDADGRMIIDFHLSRPAVAAAEVAGSPPAVVITLLPSPDTPPRLGAPAVAESVVVLSPLGGPAEYPLRVRGYARYPSGIVVAQVRAGGVTEVEQSVELDPAGAGWRAFDITIDQGPVGEVDLAVGEPDGDEVTGGVTLSLDLR